MYYFSFLELCPYNLRFLQISLCTTFDFGFSLKGFKKNLNQLQRKMFEEYKDIMNEKKLSVTLYKLHCFRIRLKMYDC